MRKIYLFISLLLLMALSCDVSRIGDSLYQSPSFSIFTDRVVQDTFKAYVKSDTLMVSNYYSPANQTYSRHLEVKFAINGKDNELPFGVNHHLYLKPGEDNKVNAPLIRFGQRDTAQVNYDGDYFLEPNTLLHLSVDMRHVLEAFEEQGYYILHDSSRIQKEDFRGVWVAGGSPPLSWDFDNLTNQDGFKLKDPDGNGIYQLDVMLNTKREAPEKEHTWQLKNDISAYPAYSSGIAMTEAMYNMSLDELEMLTTQEGTFDTGKKWPGVWTRDISYSALLSLAVLAPERTQASLLKKIKNGRIIQDTGTGGSYPVSTDRVVWAIAAWEVYKVTGDKAWLQKIFPVIKKSLNEDLLNAYNSEIHLFRGESSFLDWREQTYPQWMEPVDIYESYCLGTNAVFYKALDALVRMGDILDKETSKYQEIAHELKQSINNLLWDSKRGFYGQYLYGRHYPVFSERADALGESLMILFDATRDSLRAERTTQNTPVLDFGVPAIFPQIASVPPYHNDAIWPFVQAFRTWSAAKTGNEQAVNKSIASIYRAAALFLTNKENMVAGTGHHNGTEINSDRQLWSVAGNLAIIYRVIFGLEYHADQLVLRPFIPQNYNTVHELKNFRYRDATFNIRIEGYGDKIKDFIINGEVREPILPADLEGKHYITIFMNNSFRKNDTIKHVKNHFTISPPAPLRVGNSLAWPSSAKAKSYRIYKNGKLLKEIPDNSYKQLDTAKFTHYQVSAVDQKGWESFLSAPVATGIAQSDTLHEAEGFYTASGLPYKGYSGDGFIELDKSRTFNFRFNTESEKAGWYWLDFRYANGYGPINTDNKCAIRRLMVNGEVIGSAVFPQRGPGAWEDWGYTNVHRVYMKEGDNEIRVSYTERTKNMDGETNKALLDALRLIPIRKFEL